ncbi:radical SAM protein [Actinosynnema sp. NPDC023794]
MESVDYLETVGSGSAYVANRDRVVLGGGSRPRVLSVCFEPTNKCPGKCPYCLIEDHDQDWPTEVLRSVLAALLRHGTMRFGFGGGEPLLRPDLNELASYVRRHGGGTLLRTSGMFPMVAAETREAFDWVDLSFDTVDPDVFRKCRPGVPYEVLVENLGNLVRSACRVRVSVLITSRNLPSVERTVRYLADVGVRHVRLQRLVRRGQAKTTWRSLVVEPQVVDEVMAETIGLSGELGIDIRELRTVANTTLCIVKGDGRFYSGEPDGITRRGSVFNVAELQGVAERLFEAQADAYADA